MRTLITHARLRELLSYDMDTGEFTRLERYGRGRNKAKIGPAGTTNDKGYLCIKLEGVTYKAHRLAWFYVHGAWPHDQIDHRDTNRSNNAIANLRECTQDENAQNRIRPHRNNKSGYLGVSWDRGKSKWVPTLHINGRNKRLGAFSSAEEAHATYLAAKSIHHSFSTSEVA